MGDDGSVSRDCVIHVLTAVDSISTVVNDDRITVVRNGVPEVTVLPESVPRKMLHMFARKYGIEIAYFYNPSMVVHGNDNRH
jgi:hypothetical protein